MCNLQVNTNNYMYIKPLCSKTVLSTLREELSFIGVPQEDRGAERGAVPCLQQDTVQGQDVQVDRLHTNSWRLVKVSHKDFALQPISVNKKNDNTLDDSSFTLVYLILQWKNSASYTAKQMAITFSMHCLMKWRTGLHVMITPVISVCMENVR